MYNLSGGNVCVLLCMGGWGLDLKGGRHNLPGGSCVSMWVVGSNSFSNFKRRVSGISY
jgi:hypothetical protein